MEINLLRHGRPAIDTSERIVPAEFHAWMARYDEAGVSDRPPPYAISASGQCQYIVCSDLLRSTHSAELLGVAVDLADAIFREAGLLSFRWAGPKLHAGKLSLLARMAWVCGYSLHCETSGVARSRAGKCAERLIELALSHQQVLLIGHGMMNRLIGEALRKRKWRSVRADKVNRYWGLSPILVMLPHDCCDAPS